MSDHAAGQAAGAHQADAPPRCLLAVHAHPDDESSKGAGTVARYHDAEVRTVLVCCTGGEAGEVLNKAMDRPEINERLAEVRLEELERATKIIGYDELVLLGYRDSGMPGTEFNEDPRCFARADLDEATGRLVEVIRRERPQVVLTYGDDQSGYPHPDHLRVHDISVAAYERAADPTWRPELGEPWQVAKLYYVMWSRTRVEAMHQKMLEMGIESPFDEKWFSRPSQDHRITTRIHVGDYYDVRKSALLAHATQVDPESPFWFGLPDEVMRELHPWEEYHLARTTVGGTVPEDDLFAGL